MYKEPVFHTAKGELTAYALNCGYVQKFTKDEIEVSLWKEHNTYHVRQHDIKNHKRIQWCTFEKANVARRKWNDTVKQMKGKNNG